MVKIKKNDSVKATKDQKKNKVQNEAKVESPKEIVKQKKSDLVSIKGGKVNKNKKPISKKIQNGNKLVRKAISSGDIANAENLRRKEQDIRTLYLRFDCEKKPETDQEIQKIHPDIKNIRILRQAKKRKQNKPDDIRYCFAEFENESKCEEAKRVLSQKAFQGGQIFADFVGEKSSKKSQKKKVPKRPINPTRLFVTGAVTGLTPDKLKELFPKSKESVIPVKGKKRNTKFAFVQFSSPLDAKNAFDASKNLSIDGNNLTVLFAKMRQDKKKRKLQEEEEEEEANKKKEGKTKSKKAKVMEENEDSDQDIENDVDDNEEDEEVENDEEDSEVENDKEEVESGDDEEVENDKEEAESEDDEEVENDESEDDEEVENDDDDDD